MRIFKPKNFPQHIDSQHCDKISSSEIDHISKETSSSSHFIKIFGFRVLFICNNECCPIYGD